VTEDNRIETTSGADSRLSGYSSNNFKKSLDLAKKISDRNSDVGTNDNYQTFDVAEKSNNSERTVDIYSRLLKDRIIFLGSEIDSDLANLIVAQMLFLETEYPDKEIYLYINSPGGSVSAGMGIFDMMNQVRPNVCTVCMGFAAGMAGFLLGAGARGKRMSLPNARIILCQPTGGVQGLPTDIEIQAREILYIKSKFTDLLAQQTGQSVGKIQEDTDRDFYLSAIQAKEYGLIDTVLDRPVSESNPPIFTY
jgi:ATP-dependent Clp protease, protease subunit